ncbi:MAG TPA: TIGR02206 family membrane protein [Chthoniobacteraceae bacterium]|nr:TIGR02206 family membrane protein [Chthoniobacteraceae bacterium]
MRKMRGVFTGITMFGPSHLAVLAATAAIAAALSIGGRAGGERTRRNIALGLAAVLLANKPAVYWTILVMEKQGWRDSLPMYMCDWSGLAAIAALLWRGQTPYEMAYFWGLGGTLQAMVTPDLSFDFPDIRFLTFFISHGGTLVAVAFLTFAVRMRPWPVSLLRIILWSNVYLLVAGVVDWSLDENYGYLRAKPGHASLLDHLGPWPWYILSLEGAAIVSFLIYYCPFFVADLLRKRRAGASAPAC